MFAKHFNMAIYEEKHVHTRPNGNRDDKSDIEQLRKIFTELRDKSGALCGKLDALKDDIAAQETKEGLSWLELKNHLLLNYLIDTNNVVYDKLKGKSIAASPAVRRLIETRTVLERMRPIDQKLKYQIQKMQKIAVTGKVEANDPLRFKANPDAFEFDNDNDNKEDTQDNEAGTSASKGSQPGKAVVPGKPALYVPPKLTPLQYLEDETDEARKDRQMERAKRKALSSSLIAELQREYHEGPIELREEYNPHKEQLNKRKREREQYEEDNFVRLQVSKQERHANRLQGFAALDDITKFGGGNDLDFSEGHAKKRRKGNTSSKKKWGSKGFKKRK